MGDVLSIAFHGAARTVTGSRHLLRFGSRRLLFDCGLYQGHRDEAERINRTFRFAAGEVDAVVVSHAHLDHAGNLPTLTAQGYRGPVHMTPATADLSRVMLPDSAFLMQKDVEHVNRRGNHGRPPRRPLYTLEDVEGTLERIESHRYHEAFAPLPGVRATYQDAGHILGSAITTLEFESGGRTRRVCMAGDVGRPRRPILRDPETPPSPDVLVLESTYGDRRHADDATTIAGLIDAVTRTAGRGGRLLVPAFAVGRTQELVATLHELMTAGRIPDLPMFVDSPMARNATAVFVHHPECFDAETFEQFRRSGGEPFGFARLRYVGSPEESRALDERGEPCILVSASGMCEGGRVVHHLQHALGDARNTVLFVGYQGEGTLGRRLRDGAEMVNVLGEPVRVRAEIAGLDGFSAHADQAELLEWVASMTPAPRTIFLVHGDLEPAQVLADLLRQRTGATVHIPDKGEGIRAVELNEPCYQVGQRLQHPVFGEGLIVEVHTDRGREVLEVVFDGQLRRLSAAREWAILDGAGAFDSPADELPEGDGPGLAGPVRPGAGPARRWHPQGDELLERWLRNVADPQAHFDVRAQAEEWAGWASAERLLSLDSLRGVERFPHQVEACLRVLRDFGGRGILADEVGLGKTVEAGIVLKEYLLRGAVRTALVLVPASLCEQWRAELWEKFELDFVVSRGPAGQWGRHPLVISSLETARHERHRRRVRGANYDMVVVDEAHRLRNHLTLGWKFINDLNPRYLLLLTATPVQNDLRELYNLVTLVRPGTVGTFSQFRRDFLSGHDKRTPRNTPRLRRLLRSVMIRTRRGDTQLTFAPRRVETMWVPQSAAERGLYRQVSEFVADAVHGDAGQPGKPHYFTLMVLQKEMGSSWAAACGTLVRLASHPDGLDPRRVAAFAERARVLSADPSKLRTLLRTIASLKDEKAIVFTQFRASQEAIGTALREAGVSHVLFHGELGWREKEEALEDFRQRDRVLVSTEAGGEGRNLQFARNIVNFDLPWNPMRLEQRIGRVHRLGQEHPVRVVNLVARGTIEAYVLEILERKIRMFELVVGEMEEILGAWNTHGSFEDEVFKRWTESHSPRVRKKRFVELAQHLVTARKIYQQQRDDQNWLFRGAGENDEEASS